jgi:23S rRNA pseudouridine955/2504/2580 synthase
MMITDTRIFTVTPTDDGIRLDRWFKRNLPDANFNLVSRWARTGQLRIDGKRAGVGDRIEAGQIIRVPPSETVKSSSDIIVRAKKPRPILTEDEANFAQSLIIYKDVQALILNKPPGLATQGGTGTDEHVDRLLDALCYDNDARPKLVHRLDKDTSGALLVARSARSAGHFAKAFSSRTARKVYWALIIGVPDIFDGMIELPIAKQPGSGGEKMHVDMKEGQAARTRYRVIDRAGNNAAWVELQPFTGRTHQLRVHMAAIGHPIIGDGKYGGRDAFLTGSISRKMHLHARRLRVDGLDGSPQIDVRADLPPHFTDSLVALGFTIDDGDAMVLDEVKFKDTDAGKRRIALNIAKSARKERKGERRGRGSNDSPRAPQGRPQGRGGARG